MNVTITLDVIGSNTGNFNLYEDNDLFTTAIATNITPTQLSSGYLISGVNNASTTIRALSLGTCGNYEDISINAGDTTPEHTADLNWTLANKMYGVFNGKNDAIFFETSQNEPWTTVTTDNGSTATSLDKASIFSSTTSFIGAIYNGSDFFVLTSDKKIYKITNYSSGLSLATFTLITTLTTTYTPLLLGYAFINNTYYVATGDGVFRSTDNINYTLVNNNTLFFQCILTNYGSDIYAASYNKIYHSADNGINWSLLYTLPTSQINTFYVESSQKMLYNDGTSWFYSTNGGTSFTQNNMSSIPYFGEKMIKYNELYYFSGQNFLYSTLDPYAATVASSTVVAAASYNQYLHVNRSKLFLSGSGINTYTISNT